MSLYGQTEYQKTKNYKIWDPDISGRRKYTTDAVLFTLLRGLS